MDCPSYCFGIFAKFSGFVDGGCFLPNFVRRAHFKVWTGRDQIKTEYTGEEDFLEFAAVIL